MGGVGGRLCAVQLQDTAQLSMLQRLANEDRLVRERKRQEERLVKERDKVGRIEPSRVTSL